MKTVTRVSITEAIYEEIGLSRKDSGDVLDMVIEEIKNAEWYFSSWFSTIFEDKSSPSFVSAKYILFKHVSNASVMFSAIF